jgi:hypothetical protein
MNGGARRPGPVGEVTVFDAYGGGSTGNDGTTTRRTVAGSMAKPSFCWSTVGARLS